MSSRDLTSDRERPSLFWLGVWIILLLGGAAMWILTTPSLITSATLLRLARGVMRTVRAAPVVPLCR